MKTDNKIPYDLKRYSRNYALKRILACVVMLALLGTALALWIDIIFSPKLVSFKILFCIVVMAVPFILTGVPFKLFDRTYCGTVERVDVETTVDSDAKSKPTWQTLYWRNIVYLTVRCEDGKLIKSKVQSERVSAHHNEDLFKAGDKVFHLYGSKYTVILPKKSDTHVECAVCGSSNNIENDRCRNCEHTLVK